MILVPDESQDSVVLSTGFDPREKGRVRPPRNQKLAGCALAALEECLRVLRFGGLLFVYGLPAELVLWAERLMLWRGGSQQMVFKYWIALDIDDAAAGRLLKPSHLGLLLFMKDRAERKTRAKFRLDTDRARVPHRYCAACGLNVKDWGGKKHLMNPRGAVLSDVWRDLPRRCLENGAAPADVLQRVAQLTGTPPARGLHVVLAAQALEEAELQESCAMAAPTAGAGFAGLEELEQDRVYLGDCVAFLERVKRLRPEGVFDLAFADPPYNLEKGYGAYEDALAEEHYVQWCNAWLAEMAETLKPGGSLFVLNLPKWAVHHAAFLHRRLEFQHWVAWDALSDPRGKMMPAHYALLYYTKPGGIPVFNYAGDNRRARPDAVLPPDSPKYCLRARCIQERKRAGDDEKVALSDVWFDIHRIKHKRDRDAHPCQLPEKLLERIIKLTTPPGGVVFDPFCGAGTTAIAAVKLGRRFVTVDVDANYARITREKLAALQGHADLFGSLVLPRESVSRPRRAGSKRGIETYLQTLARRLGRMPTETDVGTDRPEILAQIDATYATRSAAFKRAKIGLASRTPAQAADWS